MKKENFNTGLYKAPNLVVVEYNTKNCILSGSIDQYYENEDFERENGNW